MRIELMHSCAVLLTALSACVSTSIRDDVSRIQTLANVTLPAEVTTADVDPETNHDVHDLLAKPLDADIAVRIALINNRELRATLRDLGMERGQLVQAGLLPNPTFEFDVRDAGRAGLPLQQDYYLEYELTRALLTPLRVGAAEADLESARYRVAGEIVATAYRVRAAFYTMQAAEQRLRVMHKALDTLAAARDAGRALYQAGNVAGVEAASNIAELEEARARAGELELEALDCREEMQRLLGLNGPDTEWTAVTDLTALPENAATPSDLERQVIVASLALARTKSRLEALGKRAGLARTEGWLPEISIDGHIEQDLDLWERGAGATIRVPLFDRNQGLVASYRAEFDGLAERYHGLAVTLRSRARQARNRLLSTHARAKHYEATILPARSEVLRQLALQYNAMQVGIFPLLQARTRQLDAELARIDTLRDFWVARAALDALLAGHALEEESH